MAAVTGPISTLPGSTHSIPAGTMCDEHPEVPATHRIQGETDSFGCEMIDMCGACHQEYKLEVQNQDRSGCCDWCKSFADKLRNYRDVDEGSAGPVYQVCSPCIEKDQASLASELDDEY